MEDVNKYKSWEEVKKDINRFIIRYGIICFIFLAFLLYLFQSLNFGVKHFFYLFLVLTVIPFFALLIYALVSSYRYFSKNQGRSLWNVPWNELRPFEQAYNIKVRKVFRLYLIYLLELLIFSLFFMF